MLISIDAQVLLSIPTCEIHLTPEDLQNPHTQLIVFSDLKHTKNNQDAFFACDFAGFVHLVMK